MAIPLVSDYTGGDEQDSSEEAILCPACRTEGKHVKNITVRHLVKKELIEKAGQCDYRICMNEKCGVAYYDEGLSIIFEKKDLRVPLWYKEDASPRYACYCSRITDMDAIRKHYDPEAKCHCNVKNPTGKCCTDVFKSFIRKTLA